MTDRNFWIEIRRAMIIAIRAIEREHGIETCFVVKPVKHDGEWITTHPTSEDTTNVTPVYKSE